jgi:hypothetical protein
MSRPMVVGCLSRKAADRPEATRRPSTLAGTWQILRICLRRKRRCGPKVPSARIHRAGRPIRWLNARSRPKPVQALILPFHRGGAPGGTRTPTPSRVPDFESGASTGSATGACAKQALRAGIIAMATRGSTRQAGMCPGHVARAPRSSQILMPSLCRRPAFPIET